MKRSGKCRLWAIGLVLPFVGVQLHAQTASDVKGDVAVGYAVVTALSNSATGSEGYTFPLGWLVSAAGHVGAHAAIVGEVGGSYRTQTIGGTDVNSNIHSFAAGLRVLGGTSHTVGFAQCLVGGARTSSAVSGVLSLSETGFVLLPGVGVDVSVAKSLALRPQAEFAIFRASGITDHAFRVAINLVFQLR